MSSCLSWRHSSPRAVPGAAAAAADRRALPLGAAGGRTDAYADARRTLIEELGTEPGRELQELQRAVLRQDPRWTPRRRGAGPRSPQPAESRKTVTVLIADVDAGRRARRPGSTARGDVGAGPARGAGARPPRRERHDARRRSDPRRLRRALGSGRRLAAGGHGGRRSALVRPRRPCRTLDGRGCDRRSGRLGRAGRRGCPA